MPAVNPRFWIGYCDMPVGTTIFCLESICPDASAHSSCALKAEAAESVSKEVMVLDAGFGLIA
jgi:hypothetical protein